MAPNGHKSRIATFLENIHKSLIQNELTPNNGSLGAGSGVLRLPQSFVIVAVPRPRFRVFFRGRRTILSIGAPNNLSCTRLHPRRLQAQTLVAFDRRRVILRPLLRQAPAAGSESGKAEVARQPAKTNLQSRN